MACRARLEQGLYGAALVHGGVCVGGLFEGEREVEHDAGLDPAVEGALEQVGK